MERLLVAVIFTHFDLNDSVELSFVIVSELGQDTALHESYQVSTEVIAKEQ